MKLHLALVFAPLLVQCGTSSASHGSSSDSGADASDAGEDATGSSSGGVADAGPDGSSGSSGSGGGGGDGAVPTACKTAMTPAHLSYTVSNNGTSDVMTLSFDVDAVWGPGTPMPAPSWDVYARGSTCVFASAAQLRLSEAIAGSDAGSDAGTEAGTDGGIGLPTTAMTWTIAGHEFPQSPSDASISLSEALDPASSSAVGNYWLSKSGTITGMPVGTDCYELDFTNVPFAADPQIHNPSINMASGSFVATGTARVGSGCQ